MILFRRQNSNYNVISFSIPSNPVLLLLTELVDGCCGFTAMIAGSYYAAAEAPPGMLASFNGILAAATASVGIADNQNFICTT